MRKSPGKAAASGWIGGALEYYDFFNYAQAAARFFATLTLQGCRPVESSLPQRFCRRRRYCPMTRSKRGVGEFRSCSASLCRSPVI
ncbi:hypothetical protein [Nocardia pseudovaccinii]|uniref:hypothetical protein n=1 Tax=Nocardia pseudovaccinii TaxID=189540 RepID=UPI0007A39CBB|nr:hypothetical protein [Nocardia pseudovaccinii]